ncbi:MAG: hypothetical protein WD069_21500 [Planctomycetales bacterium]
MLKQLWMDEAGFVVSAELVLVLTIGVLAMVVGLHAVAKSVTQELNDVASAIGVFDQSFEFLGLSNRHAKVRGSAFQDAEDDCDCAIVIQPAPRPKVQHGAGDSESGRSR